MKEKKKKIILNANMARIIVLLDRLEGKMTPNDIAKKTGISYITVRKHLDFLRNNKLIIEEVEKDDRDKDKQKIKSKTKRYSLNYAKIYPDKKDVEEKEENS